MFFFQKGYFDRGEVFPVLTHQMRMLLLQIENAELMGNCIVPYIDSKVLELLSLHLNQSQKPISDSLKVRDIDAIHEAGHILIGNIHNPPRIQDLARQVGINEKKLKQGFHKVFNTTPYGYLFEYKMNLAVQMLRNTSKTITEIGYLCGYNSPSHFCSAFKGHFGVSPGMFVK